MFFFLSGYLFLKEHQTFNLRRKLISIIRYLLLPYFIFTLIFAFPKAVVHDADIADTFMKILTGDASWFVSTLIVTEFLFSFILWKTKGKTIPLSIVCISLFIVSFVFNNKYHIISTENIPNQWNWQSALFILIFLYLGYIYHKYEKYFHLNTLLYIIPLIILFIIIKIYIYGDNEYQMNMVPFIISNIPLFLSDCILSIIILIQIAKGYGFPNIARQPVEWRLKVIKTINWTGSHSLVYYFICGGIPVIVGKIFNIIIPYNGNYLLIVLAFIIVYALTTAITWIIYRYFPFIVGKSKKLAV